MLTSVDAVVARAGLLAQEPGRRILGIAGAPGAGKSVLASVLVQRLGGSAVVVPMDGFHLAQEVLAARGLLEVKGAPQTFDTGGYLALLRRLRENTEPVVHAPRFDRDIEEPIGSAVAVPRDVPLVITEGNYLLLDEQPWDGVRALCDETWFLDPGEERRRSWLIGRHEAYGRSAGRARERALGSDEANARRVRASAARADVLVTLPSDPGRSPRV